MPSVLYSLWTSHYILLFTGIYFNINLSLLREILTIHSTYHIVGKSYFIGGELTACFTSGKQSIQLPEDGATRNKDEIVKHSNINNPQPLKKRKNQIKDDFKCRLCFLFLFLFVLLCSVAGCQGPQQAQSFSFHSKQPEKYL